MSKKSKPNNRRTQKNVDTIRAYQEVFNSPKGQTVLYDLLKSGYFLKHTFDRIEGASLRNEGRREMCLYILEKMNTDVGKILKLIENEENIEEEYFT